MLRKRIGTYSLQLIPYKATSAMFVISFSHLPSPELLKKKKNLFIHILVSFHLKEYKCYVWVCHDLVKTKKMDSRQREKKKKEHHIQHILFHLLNPLKEATIVLS